MAGRHQAHFSKSFQIKKSGFSAKLPGNGSGDDDDKSGEGGSAYGKNIED